MGPAPVLLLLPAGGGRPGSGGVGGPDQEGEDLKGTGSINHEAKIKLIQEISTFSISSDMSGHVGKLGKTGTILN